jgi:hypothetical protein
MLGRDPLVDVDSLETGGGDDREVYLGGLTHSPKV